VMGPPTVSPEPSQSSMTLAQGQTTIVPVVFSSAAADAGLSFTVACTVSPATGPACSPSPSTLTLDSNGSGNVQVSLTASAPSKSLVFPRRELWQILLLTLLAILGIALLLVHARFPVARSFRRLRWGLALLLFTALISLAMAACSGGGNSSSGQSSSSGTSGTSGTPTGGTPTGSYTVNVTAKSVAQGFQTSGSFTITVVP
jgi:uncharacterized membrane protein YgcG